MLKSIKDWYHIKIRNHNIFKRKKMSNIDSDAINIRGTHYFISRAMVTDIPDILFISNNIYHQNLWNKSTLKKEFQNDSTHIYFVLRHKDRLVGFSGFNLLNEQRKCDILDVLVIPEFDNYGLRKYILSMIIKKMKLIHFKKIDFTIDNINEDIKSLTKELGFEEIDSNKNRTKMILNIN